MKARPQDGSKKGIQFTHHADSIYSFWVGMIILKQKMEAAMNTGVPLTPEEIQEVLEEMRI